MGYPRSFLVDPLVGGTYHCVSRCVRRESLIGSPRRCAWVVRRLELLAGVFAIDVCDFAVMRNHVHLLLRTHPDLAMAWSDQEVATRWLGRPGAAEGEEPDADLATALDDPPLVSEWRSRLSDLGWFHKLWKEPAAKAWNLEDDTPGHFWEGRYRSIGCPDDPAVLMQATYILLNPVHCGAEKELADSPRSSMGRRLKALAREIEAGGHRRGVEAYQAALLEPAIPCDPGSEVPRLDDREWSRRLAERAYERALREAAAEEARRTADRARRFDRRALDEQARAAGRPPKPETNADPAPCSPTSLVARGARLLRTRQPAPPPRRIPAPPWVAAPRKENPWRRRSVLPMAGDCTLLAFVEFADDRGRVERRDKAGRIDPNAPRAVAKLIAEREARGASGRRAEGRPEGTPPAAAGVLGAARPLLDSLESAVAGLLGADAEPRRRDGPPLVGWRGSVAGGADAARREAGRRGARRAEAVQPVPARR